MATVDRNPLRIVSQLDGDDRLMSASAQRGRVVEVTADGRVLVDFPGNTTGAIPAALAVGDLELAEILRDPHGTELLLVFEDNDLTRPLIVGRVRERVPDNGIEISVRGRRFTVEAEEDVELRCGDAKVRISRDGKVVVLGNDVVSRARRGNKIKGGTVNIN